MKYLRNVLTTNMKRNFYKNNIGEEISYVMKSTDENNTFENPSEMFKLLGDPRTSYHRNYNESFCYKGFMFAKDLYFRMMGRSKL